jgi:hypothetical protein
MQDILSLASANLLTPMILCFALGLFAASNAVATVSPAPTLSGQVFVDANGNGRFDPPGGKECRYGFPRR